MTQRLPVFRAARLVGVSRNTLQKKIRQQGISTFEGSIDLHDLLTLYPKADLSHDTEYERVQHIKATAFGKRVRERALPDAEVLSARITEISRVLADTQTHLSQYHSTLEQVASRLSELGSKGNQKESHEEIYELAHLIKTTLQKSEANMNPEQDLLAHNMVLGIMSAHIKIQPSNHEFWLEGSSNILEAAVQSGIALNYGCTSGNCGLCKARVVSGEVKKIQNHDYVLSEAEKNMNYVLLCSNTAVSDVVIEALEAKDENDIPYQEITTKVKKIDQLNENVIVLHLQTPRVQRLRFLAGQSVTLSLPDGRTSDLPVASCPCDDRNLLFHIQEKNKNSTDLLISNTLSKGDEVIVTGPKGKFLLNETSKRDQLFIAFGTGFAPIKSLIEHAMAIDESVNMHLYWVVDNQEDLYLDNLCRSWNDALENFNYHPTIGKDVTKAVADELGNIKDCDVYLAGTESQTIEVKKQLLNEGVRGDHLIVNNINQ